MSDTTDEQMTKLRALFAGDGNPPAARVLAYLDTIDDANDRTRETGKGWQYSDTIHALNGVELSMSDLRDVLEELTAADELIENVLNGRREAATAALAAWDAAVEGDSGDAELEAGSELADILAAVFNIERG